MAGAGATEHDAAQQGHRCEEEEEGAAAEEARGGRRHVDAGQRQREADDDACSATAHLV